MERGDGEKGERRKNEGKIRGNKGGVCGITSETQNPKILYLSGFSDPHGAKSLLSFDFQKSEFLVVSGGQSAELSDNSGVLPLHALLVIVASVRRQCGSNR